MNLILSTPDAELLSEQYVIKDEKLHIFLNLWNDEKICVVFNGVISFCFLANSDPVELRICKADSDFLISSLSHLYESDIPKDHNYVFYEFVDNDDYPFIKIVANNYEIIKTDGCLV